MLQYLIILLDESSASYCHYSIPDRQAKLISLDNLKKGILFAMKENLTVQFVYPATPLPPEYCSLIETIDHVKIKPANAETKDADIIIFDGFSDIAEDLLCQEKSYVLRTNKTDYFLRTDRVSEILEKVSRLNVVITDVDSYTSDDLELYKESLEKLCSHIERMYLDGFSPQINILTDRLFLTQMNNCNAGDTNITLAPDGRFYTCPAFYYEIAESKYMGLGGPSHAPFSVGDLDRGLDIKNPQLYNINHAPLCRICDAYQCKRCVWLNRKLTREVNTPSHEQCVMAHLERNASRQLLEKMRQHGTFLPEQTIKKISYLDPFDVKEEW